MAFKFKLKILPVGSWMRCRELEIYDDTGTGSEGWGASGNPAISDVTALNVKIILSDGAVYTGNIYSSTLPFPNTSGIPYILDKLVFNQDIPDGKINIEATVTGDSGGVESDLGKFTGTFYNTCNVFCCVQKLQAKVTNANDPCSDKDFEAYNKARSLYMGLLGAIDCKKWTKADNILKRLQTLCTQNNCNCGCS